MRILALATDAFGGAGGIAQSNRNLFTAIVEEGEHNEICILPRRTVDFKNTLPRGIKQYPARMNKVSYTLYAMKIAFKNGPFDVVFCGHLKMVPLAMFLRRWLKAPVWLHIHGIEVWNKPAPWVRKFAEKTSMVTAVSRFTRRKFLGWADMDPSLVKILPNTFSEKFKPGIKNGELLKKYGLEGKKVLLTVGRISKLERYKGHDRVISVLSELSAKYPDLVYLIAGEGDDTAYLEGLAEQLGVRRVVHFTGKIEDKDLPDIYRLADVFVMPSTGEGFGIVFLEAAACGIPVVGGNQDGSIDCLEEGIGYAVNPYDKNALIGAILKALTKKKTERQEILRFSKKKYEATAKLLAKVVNENSDALLPYR